MRVFQTSTILPSKTVAQDSTSGCPSSVYLVTVLAWIPPNQMLRQGSGYKIMPESSVKEGKKSNKKGCTDAQVIVMDNLHSVPPSIAQEMVWRQRRVVPWMSEEAGELSP